MNTNVKELLEPMVGQKYLTSWVQDDFVTSTSKTYLNEVQKEANDIYNNPNETRFLDDIFDACYNGKIAEAILREDPNFGPLVQRSSKKYHDLHFPLGNCEIEVKRWKQRDIDRNIIKYISKSTEYNKSKWLVIFTFDNAYTWLDRVINVEDELKAYNFEDKKVVSHILTVYRRGNSYTIKNKLLRELHKEENVLLEFVDEQTNNTIIKPLSWFQSHKRESNDGYERGGWYVMHKWV